MENVNLLTILFTGLFTGSLTCLAVQGGLLASSIAQQTQKDLTDKTVKTQTILHISTFLIAKLIGYTLIGFILGYLGSLIQLSLQLRALIQFAVALFMLATAANLLNLHPIFRYFVIQPPRFLTKYIRKQSKSTSLYAPALLGFFTIFIPCGTTQAMMALAISTGNAFLGALVMFIFTLGTSPVFFVLGYLTNTIYKSSNTKFSKIVASLLVVMALYNIDGALALSSSPITINSIAKNVWCTISLCDNTYTPSTITESPTIFIEKDHYSPTNISIKRGSKVRLNVVNKAGGGCIQAFTIPSFNIEKIVAIGKSDFVEFTAPDKPGKIKFMCSMGMFSGEINVI